MKWPQPFWRVIWLSDQIRQIHDPLEQQSHRPYLAGGREAPVRMFTFPKQPAQRSVVPTHCSLNGSLTYWMTQARWRLGLFPLPSFPMHPDSRPFPCRSTPGLEHVPAGVLSGDTIWSWHSASFLPASLPFCTQQPEGLL